MAPIHLCLRAGPSRHDFRKVQAGKNKLACKRAFDFMNSLHWPKNAAILIKRLHNYNKNHGHWAQTTYYIHTSNLEGGSQCSPQILVQQVRDHSWPVRQNKSCTFQERKWGEGHDPDLTGKFAWFWLGQSYFCCLIVSHCLIERSFRVVFVSHRV